MAGETLVLAHLIINADGTITGVAKAQDAVAGLKRNTKRDVDDTEKNFKNGFDKIGLSSKKLLAGFLNIRQAIRGLFLGFSVGTAVFALANLITSTITASDWFKRAKEAVVDWFRTVVMGESDVTAALDRIGKKAKELGVRTREALRAEMWEIQKSINEMVKQTQGTMERQYELRTAPEGFTYQVYKGMQRVFPEAGEMSRLKEMIEDYRRKLVQLEQEYGKFWPEAKKAAGAQDNVNESLGEAKKFVPDTTPFQPNVVQGGPELDPSQQMYQSAVEIVNTGVIPEITEDLKDQNSAASDLSLSLSDLVYQYGNVIAFAEQATKAEIEYGLEAQKVAFANTALAHAVQGAAEAYVMFAAGEGGIKKMLAGVLKGLAVQAAAEGMFNIILGIARIAKSYGTDPTGPALIAAGVKFLALSAALGVVAGQLSKGGGSGGYGGGGYGGGAAASEQEAYRPAAQTVYHVTIDGTTLIGTPEEVARALAELLRTVDKDNA